MDSGPGKKEELGTATKGPVRCCLMHLGSGRKSGASVGSMQPGGTIKGDIRAVQGMVGILFTTGLLDYWTLLFLLDLCMPIFLADIPTESFIKKNPKKL